MHKATNDDYLCNGTIIHLYRFSSLLSTDDKVGLKLRANFSALPCNFERTFVERKLLNFYDVSVGLIQLK